jgi:hypothetical protein
MLGQVSNALNSGSVVCEMLSATPPVVRIRLTNGECTALVRHALLASLWKGRVVVITSSVHLLMEGTEILVVLGVRDATPADAPAAFSPCNNNNIPSSDIPLLQIADTQMRKSTPIADLSSRRGTRPDLTGKVAFKGKPIPFKNGAGEMIPFQFEDESGKIRAVAFSPECHELDTKLRIGGTYRITGGRCKKADARFSETSHEFELVLDATTSVQELKQYE